MNKQKGFTLVEALLIVVILCIVGFAGYTVWNNQKSNEPEPKQVEAVMNETEQQINSINKQVIETTPSTVVSGEFINDDKTISFKYPETWDSWSTESKFYVTSSTISESLLAPMGGGGGGLRHIYDKGTDTWLNLESYQKSVDEGIKSEHLTQEKFDSTDYTVAHGAIGEGGGISYYFLITDGSTAYQVQFPFIAEETDSNSAAKAEELASSAKEIINSVEFL